MKKGGHENGKEGNGFRKEWPKKEKRMGEK